MFHKYAVIACIFVFVLSVNAGAQKQLKDYFTNLPFIMPEMKEPQFPNRIFSIMEYGAIADGHTMNTNHLPMRLQHVLKQEGERCSFLQEHGSQDRSNWKAISIFMWKRVRLFSSARILMSIHSYKSRRTVKAFWENSTDQCI